MFKNLVSKVEKKRKKGGRRGDKGVVNLGGNAGRFKGTLVARDVGRADDTRNGKAS